MHHWRALTQKYSNSDPVMRREKVENINIKNERKIALKIVENSLRKTRSEKIPEKI